MLVEADDGGVLACNESGRSVSIFAYPLLYSYTAIVVQSNCVGRKSERPMHEVGVTLLRENSDKWHVHLSQGH